MSGWRLVPCEPVGEEQARVLVRLRTPTGATCRPTLMRLPVYAARAEAVQLRARRLALDLTLREAARKLGLTAPELSDLETGRADLADPADWPRLLAALEEDVGR